MEMRRATLDFVARKISLTPRYSPHALLFLIPSLHLSTGRDLTLLPRATTSDGTDVAKFFPSVRWRMVAQRGPLSPD